MQRERRQWNRKHGKIGSVKWSDEIGLRKWEPL